MGQAGSSPALKGRVGKTGAGFYLVIFKRELGGKEKEGNIDGGGRESPFSLNLAPTSLHSKRALRVDDY